MKNVPVPAERLTRAAICEELQQLQASIPMFASWLVPELERIAGRYSEILLALVQLETFDVLCKELLVSLQTIQGYVRETVETEDWRPFNKAGMALKWDMDELIRMLR